MKRIEVSPRPEWKELAEKVGFLFHTIDGEPYWDETRAYAFSLKEIENEIEDPTAELELMCLELVDKAVRDEEILKALRIPEPFWNVIRNSWRGREKNLYGRFDFSYDGRSAAKLLEYNADTPTSLYEAAAFQWWWLERLRETGEIPRDADQFNSIEEKIVDALRNFGIQSRLHFAHVGESEEDRATVVYLSELAKQAGLMVNVLPIEQIGIDAQGRFSDQNDFVIENLFKLYPWEWLVTEPFGEYLQKPKARIIEPAWKMILSNKGLLPLLWKHHTDHPNLLPAYFDNDREGFASLGSSYVRKPLFSREGANVHVVTEDGPLPVDDKGYGEEGYILQAFHPLPRYGEDYAVIGSWVVASKPEGIGIREDTTLVTRNTSRFVPHFIE